LFYFFGSTSRIKKQIFYECQVLGVTTAIKVSGERKKNKKNWIRSKTANIFFLFLSLSVDYRIVSALAPSVRIVTRQKRMSEEFLRALLGGCLTGPSTIISFHLGKSSSLAHYLIFHPTAQQKLKGPAAAYAQSTGVT
jgi:hypothetical protein